MGAQLLANLRVTLVFYRRNNLLLLMVLVILAVGALGLVPSLIFETSGLKFALIQQIFEVLDNVATAVAAVLGLLPITYHLRSRSLKMVVTKPCPPDTWLLSVFAAAILVTGAIYLAVLVLVSALFPIWGVPYQWGVVYLALAGLLEAVVVLCYLGVLTLLLHPALAVLVALFFQDRMFKEFVVIAQAGMGGAGGSEKWYLAVLAKVMSFFYMVLPSFAPFGEKVRPVRESYRVTGEAWQYLSLTFAYTALLAALFYFVGCWALRRKRLI